MEHAIQSTIEYTRERRTFGQPVLNNQHVFFKFAELQTEVEALRSLLYRACGLYVTTAEATALVSMAKYKAGKLSRVVADECLQFWGGMGYAAETPISRYFRCFLFLQIFFIF